MENNMQSHHDLAREFPDMKDTITTLKTNDAHFRRLFDEYDAVVHELHIVDEGRAAIDDEAAEHLKKKRLALKDQLFAILKKEAGGCGKGACGCA